jgi:hypothetical protein
MALTPTRLRLVYPSPVRGRGVVRGIVIGVVWHGAVRWFVGA